jgi:hypothetical protein
MHLSFTRFALLVAVLAVVRVASLDLLASPGALRSIPEAVVINLDPESTLAVRERLSLACADPVSLELISGISDRLAFELAHNRARIVKSAQDGLGSEAALQLARGVGAATARKLLGYLDPQSACRAQIELPQFELYTPG